VSNRKISSAAFAFFSVCFFLVAISFLEGLSISPYNFIPIARKYPWVAKSLFLLVVFWLIYAGSLTTGKSFSLKRSANLVIISSLVTVITLSSFYIVIYFIH